MASLLHREGLAGLSRSAARPQQVSVSPLCRPSTVLSPRQLSAAGSSFSLSPQQATQQQARCIQARVSSTEALDGQPANLAGGDVYVNEPKPLPEGEEKHTISIFVADEPGLINRVAGVFARRGANIESLAVGLAGDKALFTTVVTGTSRTVANLVKQLGKLVKVRYVEDISNAVKIEREMLLLKLKAPAGPTRSEVLQLANVFRARIVDVSDTTVTLVVSGDPGKLAAIQKVMSKFGITEMARTGRVALKRGERMLSNSMPEGVVAPAEGEARQQPVSYSRPPGADSASDVYPVESSLDLLELDEDNRLTYVPTGTSDPDGSSAHTLNIEVMDVPGVLNQVTGVFARRGYNVQSLAVGPSEREGRSRIVMVVPGRPSGISNLLRQLKKLVYVVDITDLTEVPFVQRELMLVKVRCTASQRGDLRNLVEIFRGSIVDVSPSTCVVEVIGKEDKMKAFVELLAPFGVLEMARTGRVAMLRDSGVNTMFLAKMSTGRVW